MFVNASQRNSNNNNNNRCAQRGATSAWEKSNNVCRIQTVSHAAEIRVCIYNWKQRTFSDANKFYHFRVASGVSRIDLNRQWIASLFFFENYFSVQLGYYYSRAYWKRIKHFIQQFSQMLPFKNLVFSHCLLNKNYSQKASLCPWFTMRWHQKLNPRGQFVSFSISWHVDDGQIFVSVLISAERRRHNVTKIPNWENPFFDHFHRLNDFRSTDSAVSTIGKNCCLLPF